MDDPENKDPENKDPERKDRLTVGKPISAKVLNLLPIGTEALVRLDAAPPLRYTTHGDAPTLSAPGVEKIPAELSGSGPAYSWSEVAPNANGTWSTLAGGRSGTANAYEANSKTGLGGNIVQLGFTSADDYRFYIPRFGISSTCGTICIQVNDTCGVFQIANVAVTLSLGGTAVGSGTTTGQVTAVTVTGGGTGYTSAPAVTFTGGGSGAAATANMAASVATLTLTNPGGGYTTAPTVGFSGGGGSGAAATATATLVPGPVGTLTLTRGGTLYTSAPTVTIGGGGGSGATATATVTTGVVTAITLTNAGGGYTTAPTVSFGGGGGSGATATAALVPGPVDTLTLTNAGGTYTSAPSVTFSGGGGGSGATATASLTPFHVASVTVTANGSGYSRTSPPTVGFSGGGGSGAAATATVTVRFCVPITTAGTYTIGASVANYNTGTRTFTIATCASSTQTITLTPNKVAITYTVNSFCQTGGPLVGVLVTASASGATVASGTTDAGGNVTLTVPTATTLVLNAVDPLGRTLYAPSTRGPYTCPGVDFVVYAASGIVSGYQCPAQSCEDPLPVTLHLTSNLFGGTSLSYIGSSTWQGTSTGSYPGRVTGISLASGGTGYTATPTVTIAGGGGTGATAIATLSGIPGSVTAINLTNSGSGYTSAPTVTIAGGGGTGAGATANTCPASSVTLLWDFQGSSGATQPGRVAVQWNIGGGGCPSPGLPATTGSYHDPTSYSCPEAGAFLYQLVFDSTNPTVFGAADPASPFYLGDTITVTE